MDLKDIVITTRNIVYDNDKILKASHDEDGIWQFLDGSLNLDENDAMVVSLGTILEIDPSLKEILNLPMGCHAFRRDVGSNWIISNHN
jgi:hypothetical protein